MAHPPGVTIYPASGGWGHSPYIYSNHNHELGPDANNALGTDTTNGNPIGRGTSYFFGFLITFVLLLLIGICCGIASRRRYLARRQQRRMDALMDQAGVLRGGNRFLGFGGLLARDPEDDGPDIAREKPKFHDIQMGGDVGGKGKSGSSSWEGQEKGNGTSHNLGPEVDRWFDSDESLQKRPPANPWTGITPLSASIIRPPREFEPYEHFERTVAASSGQPSNPADAPPPYWARNHTTGYMSSDGDGDNLALLRRGNENVASHQDHWLSRMSPIRWLSLKRSPDTERSPSYQLTPISRASTAPRPRPFRFHGGAHRNKFEKGTNSSGSPPPVDEEARSQMEVAVVVAMPDRSTKAWSGSTSSLPEYEIGVTTASVGKEKGGGYVL